MAVTRQVGKREEIRVPELMEPISHYTDAVRVGNLLFISGVAPVDGEGNLVGEGDVLEQTRQVLRNMQAVLDSAGASFADVAKVTVYVTNMDDRTQVNIARQEFFGDARPASTLIEISRLAIDGMRVEIEAVAVVPV